MINLRMRVHLTAAIFVVTTMCGCALDSAVASDLPEWYSGNRVQIHTRARIDRDELPSESDIFFRLPNEVKRIGASVFVRHIKGSCEGTWWPSSVGRMNSVAASYDGDLAARLIEDAHNQGLRQIVYYRHFCDRWTWETHPEWLVRSRDGKIVQKQGHDRAFPYASLVSPFADYAVTQFKELAERGADGFYFDEIHTPREGDFSEYAQQKFRDEYGQELLTATDQQVAEFRQQIIVEFLARVRREVESINPGILTLISINTVNLDNLRVAHAPKYEDSFNNWLGGLESTATVLTDVGGGYPHMWRGPAETDSLYTVGRYLTFGTIYNRDIREDEFFQVPDELHPEFAQIFELGRKVSPAMKDVIPYRHARIVINGDFQIRQAPLDGQHVNRWRELVGERIPAGYLSLRQILENGIPRGTQVLVVPEGNGWEASMELSPEVQGVLEDFQSAGGLVLDAETVGDGDWIARVFDHGVPITADGGDSRLGLAVYSDRAASKYVVNISSYESDDIVLRLSKNVFSMPDSVSESVTGQILTVEETDNEWRIAVPRVEVMAQVVIRFASDN